MNIQVVTAIGEQRLSPKTVATIEEAFSTVEQIVRDFDENSLEPCQISVMVDGHEVGGIDKAHWDGSRYLNLPHRPKFWAAGPAIGALPTAEASEAQP